jgi:hypothetical protein
VSNAECFAVKLAKSTPKYDAALDIAVVNQEARIASVVSKGIPIIAVTSYALNANPPYIQN